MRTASPLRYPGGKSSMSGLLSSIRSLNGFGGHEIAEPFAGGAGASLALLYLEDAPSIHINDIDPAVSDFWWAVTSRSKAFVEEIEKVNLDIAEWHRQRAVYRERRLRSRFRKGFSAFYLNRCNRSGIIMNGGPIGGIAQNGTWKIDARFNRADLQKRCKRVAEYRERIHLSSEDGIDFIRRLNGGEVFFFIDPPYFDKGASLYLNGLDAAYHSNLAQQLRAMVDRPWVLTYDDCPEIRQMYQDWSAIRPFSLRYTAAARRTGKEIMITPHWMRLPSSQKSVSIGW